MGDINEGAPGAEQIIRAIPHGCLTTTQVVTPAKAGGQYAAAYRDGVLYRDFTEYWMPAGACHRAGRRPDPLAGMTLGEWLALSRAPE